MIIASDEDIAAVTGGATCSGFWLGTKDMQYGFCFGEWQP